MAWIESHQSLATHRKTLRLANELKIEVPTAIGHLHLLWWWGLDNVPISGSLKGISAPEIAQIAHWHSSPTLFLQALIRSGFIDKDTKHGKARASLQIHDWPEYAGKLCAARAANRERMRRARAGATVPNRTVPNPTQPNRPPPPVVPPVIGGDGKTESFEKVDLAMAGPKAKELWMKVLPVLKNGVTTPNYETWLKDTVGYSLNGDVLMVAVPSDFAAEWLTTKLRPLCAKTVSGLRDKATEIKFVVVK